MRNVTDAASLSGRSFFLGHGAYPDSQKIRELCKKEAEFLVRRLRHHPPASVVRGK